MAVLTRKPSGAEAASSQVSQHARRLKELSDEAVEIRRRHLDGKITEQEASRLLSELKNRYRSFVDRLF